MKNNLLRVTFLSVFISLIAVMEVCAAVSQQNEALKIIKVGPAKKTFDISAGETASIGFEITRKADVQVVIYNRLGRKVRTFNLPDLEAKRSNVTWDGRTDQGKLAQGELFLYVIYAQTEDGQEAVHNTALRTGGFEVKSLEYTLDHKTGKIEYVLPKGCMIRIRAGLKDGLFANNLFDWVPRSAGRHTYMWDGKDQTGQMNLLKHHDLDIRLTCYTLPANSVIMKGNTIPLDSDIELTEAQVKERSELCGTKGKYFHYQHDPRHCHAPRFDFSFPNAMSGNGNLPQVTGITPVRVELDRRDAWELVNRRFEIAFYIDGVFIYEVEEGSSPFTFNWDTKTFAKGPHIVTVNLLGYDDHIGIANHKVIIGE